MISLQLRLTSMYVIFCVLYPIFALMMIACYHPNEALTPLSSSNVAKFILFKWFLDVLSEKVCDFLVNEAFRFVDFWAFVPIQFTEELAQEFINYSVGLANLINAVEGKSFASSVITSNGAHPSRTFQGKLHFAGMLI